VALFSHNPGITEFINELGLARIDNMPTCGVFGLHIKADRWADFDRTSKTFWLFDYPKNF
jgi:phosphohistidine phosphatase